MQKMGLVRPPDHLHDSEARRRLAGRRLEALLGDVVGDDADQLAVPLDHFIHVLRLLTFAGSHEHIADGRLLTPDEIVDTVLLGLQRRD